jgi:hypothetical protein
VFGQKVLRWKSREGFRLFRHNPQQRPDRVLTACVASDDAFGLGLKGLAWGGVNQPTVSCADILSTLFAPEIRRIEVAVAEPCHRFR